MKLTPQQKRNRKKLKNLKSKIQDLEQQLYNVKSDFQRLLSEHVVLSVFPNKGEDVQQMVEIINFQTNYLRTEANRISHGQKEKLGFAICETQPGVPLHPLVWVPNEVIKDLFNLLADQKVTYTFGMKKPDPIKGAFRFSFGGSDYEPLK